LTKTGRWKRFVAATFSCRGRVPSAETVAEASHFRRVKNTFGWIQQDTILAEALKQSTQVLLVLILRDRGDQHVIYVRVADIQVPENLIDEPLKCLRGISEPQGNIREFKESEGRDNGCLGNVFRMNWDLVVSVYQIYCGEDFPASKLMCEVGHVPNGILVGDSPSIQSTIVTTGPPAVFFLGD
jgi:hypothetical protein